MDAVGINWLYLLIQLICFLSLLGLATLIAFIILIAIRSLRPDFLTRYLTNLKAGQEGLLVPSDYLGASGSYELRKFGKALILIEKAE